MLGRFGIMVAAAGSLCLIASSVPAQFPPVTDPTKDEFKCEQNAAKSLAKFTNAKAKCISKCFKAFRKLGGPYTACYPPFTLDPKTDACIHDSLKGAEAKAGASIVKKCVKDCPECYDAQDPGICTDGTGTNPFVVDSEGRIDIFPSLIYCTEGAATTPTKDEAKCEDAVSKNLTKFVGSKTKCYQKCTKNEVKGKIMRGTCGVPPGTIPATDPATVACIQKAEGKAADKIDKTCEKSLPTSKPACYGPLMGAGWVGLVEPQVDAVTPMVGCGSPSGAFLQ
jgi:hypothetical protein